MEEWSTEDGVFKYVKSITSAANYKHRFHFFGSSSYANRIESYCNETFGLANFLMISFPEKTSFLIRADVHAMMFKMRWMT